MPLESVADSAERLVSLASAVRDVGRGGPELLFLGRVPSAFGADDTLADGTVLSSAGATAIMSMLASDDPYKCGAALELLCGRSKSAPVMCQLELDLFEASMPYMLKNASARVRGQLRLLAKTFMNRLKRSVDAHVKDEARIGRLDTSNMEKLQSRDRETAKRVERNRKLRPVFRQVSRDASLAWVARMRQKVLDHMYDGAPQLRVESALEVLLPLLAEYGIEPLSDGDDGFGERAALVLINAVGRWQGPRRLAFDALGKYFPSPLPGHPTPDGLLSATFDGLDKVSFAHEIDAHVSKVLLVFKHYSLGVDFLGKLCAKLEAASADGAPLSQPVHGLVRAVWQCLNALDDRTAGRAADAASHHALVERFAHICEHRILPRGLSVVGETLRETQVPVVDSETLAPREDEGRLLRCGWQNVAVPCLVLSSLASRGLSPYNTLEAQENVAMLLLDTLLATKHNGAIDKVHLSLIALLRTQAEQGRSNVVELVAERLIEVIEQDGESVTLLRRSAGLPFAFVATLGALPDVLVPRLMPVLLARAEGGDVHAINIVRAVTMSAELKKALREQLAEIVLVAMCGMLHKDWDQRNAYTLLFVVAARRLVEAPTNVRGSTRIATVFRRYQGSGLREAVLGGLQSDHPTSALILLSRAAPAIVGDADISEAIMPLLAAADWSTRRLAALALVSTVGDLERPSMEARFRELVAGGDPNGAHGGRMALGDAPTDNLVTFVDANRDIERAKALASRDDDRVAVELDRIDLLLHGSNDVRAIAGEGMHDVHALGVAVDKLASEWRHSDVADAFLRSCLRLDHLDGPGAFEGGDGYASDDDASDDRDAYVEPLVLVETVARRMALEKDWKFDMPAMPEWCSVSAALSGKAACVAHQARRSFAWIMHATGRATCEPLLTA